MLEKFEATTKVEVVEETPPPLQVRKLIDRKTASVLLLFTIQVGIGIIMMSYRSCEPVSTQTVSKQASLHLANNNNLKNKHGVEKDVIFVQVLGQVRQPGVYQLPTGSKTFDAIAQAGGSLPAAQLDKVALTRILADEEQVIIP